MLRLALSLSILCTLNLLCTPISPQTTAQAANQQTSDPEKQSILQAKAIWLSQDYIAWPEQIQTNEDFHLLSHSQAKLLKDKNAEHTYPLQIKGKVKAHPQLATLYPHLKNHTLLKLPALSTKDKQALIQSQTLLQYSTRQKISLSGIQLAPILDAEYSYQGDLGLNFTEDNKPEFKLWAPTAQHVKLLIYDQDKKLIKKIVPRRNEKGVWQVQGSKDWYGTYYRYAITVYAPYTGNIETFEVTDPYSISLSLNSRYSQITDLTDPTLKPRGWDQLLYNHPIQKQHPEDMVIYELHVRDFSIADTSVPVKDRGKFTAFTHRTSKGSLHLQQLAKSGLSHIHLLPAFDIATIEEDPEQQATAKIPKAWPESARQQAAIGTVRTQDGFNWGYDPLHYGVPEGSYATQANGAQRILEFRQMVQALAETQLGTIMDVVYNHTHSTGSDMRSILDKIVPGYYYRLDPQGAIQSSTCCPDTASEHLMMEKLMVDTLVRWAKAYKVSGFRFDLMGHHTRQNLHRVRKALDQLTLEKDGIDGRSIYLYGEGWKFGSLDAIRPDGMHQKTASGTGIGTFNDRIRDSARGGNFNHTTRSDQGFITGLALDANQSQWNTDTPSDLEKQKQQLRNYTDNIRLGMAGNLLDFVFVHTDDKRRRGADLHYRGNPGAGYALDPQENVNYVSAHDNYSLWDQIAAKAPFHTQYRKPYTATVQERASMQELGLAIVLLGQGVPFIHAGSEILRSKSGDGDSYDSGDWFNAINWNYDHNNWGKGLPPAWRNQEEWGFWKTRLSDPAFRAKKQDIIDSLGQFQRLLMIRQSSPLFRMHNEIQVQQRVSFLNAEKGQEQTPGLIVMRLWDGIKDANLDPLRQQVLVIIHSGPQATTFDHPVLRQPGWTDFTDNKNRALLQQSIKPISQSSETAEPRALAKFQKNGKLLIPPRSISVFQILDPIK